MNEFKDAAGRRWRLAFTVGDLPRLRAAGFDLATALKTETGVVEFLFGDPERLAGVLWVLCEAQAAAAGVSPEQFAAGLDADAIDGACTALMGYVVDFRHRLPGARAAAKAAIPGAVTRAEATMAEAIRAATSPPTGGTSNPTAGDSPASAGSIPAR